MSRDVISFLLSPEGDPVRLAAALWLGLAVGGLSTVVRHRIPERRPGSIPEIISVLSRPPSACPACERRLGPMERMPVIGILVAGGRCRTCGVKIPIAYPLIEAAVACLVTSSALPSLVVRSVPAAIAPALVAIAIPIIVGVLAARTENGLVFKKRGSKATSR
jgi:leader peptidase (prepilin peptidase)/N-methyltransferase